MKLANLEKRYSKQMIQKESKTVVLNLPSVVAL